MFPKLLFLLLCLVAGLYSYVSLRGPQGMPLLVHKREEIKQLQENNDEITRQIEERKKRIEALKDSETEQELEIRKRFKVIKPGETLFIIPSDKKTAPAQP